MNHGKLIANIVQPLEREIFLAEVYWQNGHIIAINKRGDEDSRSTYLIAGFIDAHIHIESSMLAPCEFARIACRHGTVATVSDPHEIANVLGLDGIAFMVDNARLTPFQIFFGAPSGVPATPFETAGAELESEQLEFLFKNKITTYLSEMMNYPGVLNNDSHVLAKLELAKRYGCPIDGHAPGLTDDDLRRYAEAGISTDHECISLAEAKAKLAAGLSILIREGSTARNFDAIHSLISQYPDKVMFCSDDKHPDDLVTGHINLLAARAVAKGHSVFDVLRCACLNPVKHYDLPVGQLKVGDRMDAVEVENIKSFAPISTWIAGQKVAQQGKSLLASIKPTPVNRFNARTITVSDLDVGTCGQKIRVMKAVDGELFTYEVFHSPKVEDCKIVPDPDRDILLLAVINRYKPAKPALAFIEGFGLRQGAGIQRSSRLS